MPFQFEWDPGKAISNFADHGVHFEDAITLFYDPLELTTRDYLHSLDEERWLSIGATSAGPLVVVSYTDRGDTIRIISARFPTRQERKAYEENDA